MLISDKIEMRKHENSSNTRNPYKKSFTYANAKSYYEAAKELSHDVSFIDLSDGTFDPVLRYGYSHHMENETKTKEFRKLIQEADHLSFFFPIWWSAEPAILKGFLDRTLTPGFGYNYKNRKIEKLLVGKNADIFISSHGPAFFL